MTSYVIPPKPTRFVDLPPVDVHPAPVPTLGPGVDLPPDDVFPGPTPRLATGRTVMGADGQLRDRVTGAVVQPAVHGDGMDQLSPRGPTGRGADVGLDTLHGDSPQDLGIERDTIRRPGPGPDTGTIAPRLPASGDAPIHGDSVGDLTGRGTTSHTTRPDSIVKNVRRAITPSVGLDAVSPPPAPPGGPIAPRGPGGPRTGVVPIDPKTGQPVVSNVPGTKGSYGGQTYTVDENGVARIDTNVDPRSRETYQEAMFKFAQRHPELVGQTVNIFEHPDFRDASGNYIGPIDHPDYSGRDVSGWTGKDPKTGHYLIRGEQASFGNNESDFRNFFTRQIVAPPPGWQPGQVVTAGYAGNNAGRSATPATTTTTTAPSSGLARGDATVGLAETALHPVGASGISRGAGTPTVQRPAATPVHTGPAGVTTVTPDVKPASSNLGRGDVTTIGLGARDSMARTNFEPERTATFADGGRVRGRRRRRPVTIENGYADGGRASYGSSGVNLQELWSRFNTNASDQASMGQLSRFYRATPHSRNSESGSPEYDWEATNQRLGPQGAVMIDGVPYAQVGGPDRRRGGYGSVVDDSKVIYDDEFGYLSPINNLNQEDRANRNWGMAVMAALGGAAFSGGALGGEYFGYGTDPGVGLQSGAVGAPEGISRVIDPNLLTNIGIEPSAANVTALVESPAIQSAAASAGQSVTQWLSNPQNLMRAARLVGGLVSTFASGNPGNGQVPEIPPPGSGAPGTGAPGTGTPAPTPTMNAPTYTPPAPRTRTAAPNTDVGLDFLDQLDPADFVHGPADLSRWNEARGRAKPLEDLLFGEAMTAGNAQEQEAAAGRAGADAAQATQAARDRLDREAIAQGQNPNDLRGPAGEAKRLLTHDASKATVLGKNIARLTEKERGRAARVQAATVANAVAGQGLQADQLVENAAQANDRLRADVTGRRVEAEGRVLEGNATRRFNTWDRSEDRDAREYDAAASRDVTRYGIDSSREASRHGVDASRMTAQERNELDRARLNADIASGNYTRNRQDRIDTGRGIDTAIDLGSRLWSAYSSGSPGSSSGTYFGEDQWWMADGGRPVDMSSVGLDGAEERSTRGRRDYTDGARVDGPGTPTSDSVKARVGGKNIRVSKTEGVINAEGMELLDATEPGKLEALNEAGLKIRAVRKALAANLGDVGLGD